MGIRGKLVCLLFVVFAVAFAGMAALVFANLRANIRQQVRARLEVTAGAVSAFRLRLNREIVMSLAGVVGSDVMVMEGEAGRDPFTDFSRVRALYTSLPPEREAEVRRRLESRPAAWRADGGLNTADFADLGYYSIGLRRGEAEPWQVYLLPPREEFEAQYAAAARPLLLSGAAVALLCLGVSIALTRWITMPLHRLMEETRRIGSGNLEATIAAGGRDEIGRLAASFNDMARNLRDVQENLIRAEKMAALGQLATGVAHEIKNPLASLKMTTQLLLSRLPAGGDSGRIREGLDVVLAEIDRLQLYVDELLEYSRPEEPCLAAASLSAVIEDVVRFTARQCAHLRIRVETDLSPALPSAMMDARKIKQVVMNLLLNAVQATPPGGRVTIRASAAGNRLRCEVRDEGAGVPEAAAGSIFQPFFTTKEGGTGLGLSVCKTIVEQHGGAIGFENRRPGALFWFELPVVTT